MTDETDAQIGFEICVKEITITADGIQAVIDYGYFGTSKLITKEHKILGITELVNTKSAGSNGTKTVKIGQKIKLINQV